MTARLYEIAVRGHLGPRFASAVAGFVMVERDGDTSFRGWVSDSGSLLAAVDALAGFGLEITSLRCIAERESTSEAVDDRR